MKPHLPGTLKQVTTPVWCVPFGSMMFSSTHLSGRERSERVQTWRWAEDKVQGRKQRTWANEKALAQWQKSRRRWRRRKKKKWCWVGQQKKSGWKHRGALVQSPPPNARNQSFLSRVHTFTQSSLLFETWVPMIDLEVVTLKKLWVRATSKTRSYPNWVSAAIWICIQKKFRETRNNAAVRSRNMYGNDTSIWSRVRTWTFLCRW